MPIFKQGSHINLSNYRPIACLPTLSKIFEKVAYNQVFHHLKINNILNKFQFGFQPMKSTSHALIQILNHISEAFNQNKFVIAVFLDLAKAFDIVNQKILLQKLRKIGIGEIGIKWFESYLSNRKMYTFVNGKLSTVYSLIKCAVLQGGILGPLLFLIFINDIPESNLLLSSCSR